MSVARLAFFSFVGVVAIAWAMFALMTQFVRMENRGIIMALRLHKDIPEQADLDEAIADYQGVMRYVPCNAALHKDMALLLAIRSDVAMRTTDIGDADATLANMQQALGSQLACTPLDGKAWLDFAMVDTYREGFTDTALAAYKMSRRVAPEESWLAQKRLLFALKFKPLFDAEALDIAQSDIDVLEHAHPIRLNAVVKEARVDSDDALYALFDVPVK